MKSIESVIAHALTLIEKGWVQDSCATNKKNNVVKFDSPAAKNFSLYGAIHRAEVDLNFPTKERGNATRYLNRYVGGSVVSFNNSANSVKEIVDKVREILKNNPPVSKADKMPQEKVEEEALI